MHRRYSVVGERDTGNERKTKQPGRNQFFSCVSLSESERFRRSFNYVVRQNLRVSGVSVAATVINHVPSNVLFSWRHYDSILRRTSFPLFRETYLRLPTNLLIDDGERETFGKKFLKRFPSTDRLGKLVRKILDNMIKFLRVIEIIRRHVFVRIGHLSINKFQNNNKRSNICENFEIHD